MNNKKGFTLIELLAVIVILGILMLIAIPSVTKYIDSSKKEAYVKTINSMIDVVRYGVVSEPGKYSMNGKNKAVFYLTDIEIEKGSNKSPYGDLEKERSYVVVTKISQGYQYEVQAEDSAGYCIELTNVNELDKNSIKKCKDANVLEPPIYETYSIGEQITFAGSNWYVITNSNSTEDYVTLMKEKVLTNTELGEYAYNNSYNTMEFSWNDTCHNANHGYTSSEYSNCNDTSNYNNSKVKEFLESTYINTLGINNLKEVEGYQIRLITNDELTTNLKCTINKKFNNDVPQWVYKNFGESQNGVYYYWTMNSYNTQQVYLVNFLGYLDAYGVHNSSIGIRPVINLLKSSI